MQQRAVSRATPVSLVGWGFFRTNAEIFGIPPCFPTVVGRYSNVQADDSKLKTQGSQLKNPRQTLTAVPGRFFEF